MAKIPTIEIYTKVRPEAKQRILELETALQEVKKLVQQGRYYRIASLINKALEFTGEKYEIDTINIEPPIENPKCEICENSATVFVIDLFMKPDEQHITWTVWRAEKHNFCKEHKRDSIQYYPPNY